MPGAYQSAPQALESLAVAQPDLVGWYQEQGFVVNKVVQKQRVDAAIASGRSVDDLAVSMRFDLIDR